MNRARSRDTGYTIVETMIFLAVSGALFLSAMLLVNGQQRKTEFTTQVRDFDSKLQSVMGNVAAGYYSNTGQTTCTLAADSASISDITTGGTQQGQNSGCTFIGQVIVPSGGKVTIYSAAGLRRTPGANPKEVQNLAEAKPFLISATSEEYVLLNGVTITMKVIGAGGISLGSLGVFTMFNTYNGSDLSSGSAKSDIYGIIPSNPSGPIQTALAAKPPSPVDDYQLNPPTGIQICLSDGDQVGVIVLNTGSTRVTIGDTCP